MFLAPFEIRLGVWGSDAGAILEVSVVLLEDRVVMAGCYPSWQLYRAGAMQVHMMYVASRLLLPMGVRTTGTAQQPDCFHRSNRSAENMLPSVAPRALRVSHIAWEKLT